MEQELNELIRQATESADLKTLERLATHSSKFVRARVAGNKNINTKLHNTLLEDPEVGVVYWALGNTQLTRRQYARIFTRLLQPEYVPILHPSLAGHRFASIPQMQKLLEFHKDNVKLAVVNNHEGRDKKRFLRLIAPLLPPTSKKSKEWEGFEQRAYFHTYGVWWRETED